MSDWNKQIANALMGYANDDPSTANVRNSLMDVVTNRATFFPAADYADGTTRWAWPGILHEPASAWAKMLGGDASPGNAMTVAGPTIAGGMPFAARGALGSAGGRMPPATGRFYRGALNPQQTDRMGHRYLTEDYDTARYFANGMEGKGSVYHYAMNPDARIADITGPLTPDLAAIVETVARQHGMTPAAFLRSGIDENKTAKAHGRKQSLMVAIEAAGYDAARIPDSHGITGDPATSVVSFAGRGFTIANPKER